MNDEAQPKPPANAAGYSGKPLSQKLGLKPELDAIAVDPPEVYRDLIADAPIPSRAADALGAGSFDVIHWFVRDATALADAIERGPPRLVDRGMLWVSWPKKSSPLFKEVTEDAVRDAALAIGWVDVKVCAVDQDWSALKLVRRRKP